MIHVFAFRSDDMQIKGYPYSDIIIDCAISQGWVDLVGPAMLVGTFGYVIGNYLGTIVAVSLGL